MGRPGKCTTRPLRGRPRIRCANSPRRLVAVAPDRRVACGGRVVAQWGKISTSYVDRQNLTMRMSMRRFTRLTNAFSKKVENHAHAITLHFMRYNFCRIHQTLKVTPAMEAGVTDRLWEMVDYSAPGRRCGPAAESARAVQETSAVEKERPRSGVRGLPVPFRL